MVEKVAAMLVSMHCESIRGFHPGQYGCRVRRLAVDAVGVVIAQTQEAWKRAASPRFYSWMSPPLFPVWLGDVFFAR